MLIYHSDIENRKIPCTTCFVLCTSSRNRFCSKTDTIICSENVQLEIMIPHISKKLSKRS